MPLKSPLVLKTATYAAMHMTISFIAAWSVTYSLTGDIKASFLAALGISLVEPAMQVGGYYIHEKAWLKWGKLHPESAAPEWRMSGPNCPHDHGNKENN